MNHTCKLCGNEVLDTDVTWKEVIGWVGGRKKDSMRLRTDTGEVAHDICITKAMAGIPMDQEDLFTETDTPAPVVTSVNDDLDLW